MKYKREQEYVAWKIFGIYTIALIVIVLIAGLTN